MYLCITINECDINWGIYKHTITSQSENHIYYRILDNGTGYYYYYVRIMTMVISSEESIQKIVLFFP